MTRSTRRLQLAVATLASLSFPATLYGADTVEVFEKGATDVESYVGFNGAKPRGSIDTLVGELVVGYGIVDRMSAYLATCINANPDFSDTEPELSFGAIGTPIDTDHFDLDLVLDLNTGIAATSHAAVTPAVELNFDIAPDLDRAGAYLRAGVPIYGRTIEAPEPAPGETEPPEPTDDEVAVDIELAPGVYLTLGDHHQLFVEYGMAFHTIPEPNQAVTEVGGVALGYNVTINDWIELITEVSVDVPQGDEQTGVGAMLGFIGTIPRA